MLSTSDYEGEYVIIQNGYQTNPESKSEGCNHKNCYQLSGEESGLYSKIMKNWNNYATRLRSIFDFNEHTDDNFLIGFYSHRGIFGDKDYKKAENHYKLACKEENAFAMLALAYFYRMHGNTRLSEEYYIDAIDRGIVCASSELAELYWGSQEKVKDVTHRLEYCADHYNSDMCEIDMYEYYDLRISKLKYEKLKKDFKELQEKHPRPDIYSSFDF